MVRKSELFKVLQNEINKIDVRIVPAGNPWINDDKTHHDAESTQRDAVSADIYAGFDLLKGELKPAGFKGLNAFLAVLEY